MWNCCMQYFCVSKQWYGCQCQCLWFLMCAQMLCIWLHTGGCLDTTRVCTGSWPGGKLIAAPGAQTHVSIAPGFSARQSTNWAISITAPAWPGVSLSLSVSVRTITQQSVWDSQDEPQKNYDPVVLIYCITVLYCVCVSLCVCVWNALLADCSNV